MLNAQVALAHDPGNPFMVHPVAAMTELKSHAPVAVSGKLVMDLADQINQPVI